MSHEPGLLPTLTIAQCRAWLTRVRVAVVRARVSMMLIALVFAGVGVAATTQMPATYSAEARLLVRKAEVMPALAHPKRSVPVGSDSLTQSAGELVRDRRALRGIVERYDLLTRWERDRSDLARWKEQLRTWISGPIAAEDKMDALIDVLAKRILVTVDGDVIRVWAKWPDRATVVDIVQGATDAYLAARRRVDIEAIAETYTLLEHRVALSRQDVERQVAMTTAVSRIRPAHDGAGADSMRPDAAGVKAGAVDVDDSRQTRLRADLQAARATVEKLQTAHDGKVQALEAQLTDRLTRETERHPDIVALRRQLEQARVRPDDLRAAEADASARLAALVAAGGRETTAVGEPIARTAAAQPVNAGINLTRIVEDDPATVYARSLLDSSIASYQDLLERLSNTRIELETAEAAFAYRYTLVSPVQLPRKPDSAGSAVIVLGAVLAGLAAGVARAVLIDLMRPASTEVLA